MCQLENETGCTSENSTAGQIFVCIAKLNNTHLWMTNIFDFFALFETDDEE